MKRNLLVILFVIFAGICSAQMNGYIKGKITNTRDEPVGNISVVIKELGTATHTDSTGKYFFKEVPEGEYTLWFSHFSYIDTKREKVKVNAEKVTNVNMTLLPFQEERYIQSRKKDGLITSKRDNGINITGMGRLTGSISDKFGNPISFAEIRVMETDQIVQSDNFGKFLLTDVNPGIYTVAVSKFGFEERRFIGVQVKPNETTTKKVKLTFQQK